jgi:hypothetical protein
MEFCPVVPTDHAAPPGTVRRCATVRSWHIFASSVPGSAAADVGPRGARVVLTDKGPVGSLSGLAALSFAAILLRSRLVRGAGSDA